MIRNDTYWAPARRFALMAGAASAQDRQDISTGSSHGSPADPVWTYFLEGAEPVGRGYRPHRQHLVPFGRRAIPPGSDAPPRSRPGPTASVPATPIPRLRAVSYTVAGRPAEARPIPTFGTSTAP